jgi:hypothetical protein
MACKKTLLELAIALGAMIVATGGAGLCVLGLWRISNLADEHGEFEMDRHFILGGNVLILLSTVVSIGILFNQTEDLGSTRLLLAFLLLGGIIMDLYLTQFNQAIPGNVATYFFLGVNLLVRFVSVMLGYGVCNLYPSTINSTVAPVVNLAMGGKYM